MKSILFASIGLSSTILLWGCNSPASPTAASASDAAVVASNSDVPTQETKSANGADPVTLDQSSFVQSPAPDTEFVSLKGLKINLSKYKGKIVLVDNWATWCPPCRLGLPFTERLYKTFESKGLVVVAISNEGPEVVKPFLVKNKYDFPVVLDPTGVIAQKFGIQGLPTTLIFDKNGILMDQEVGLYPQAATIEALQRAGLDVSGFSPQNDPALQ